VLFKFCRISDDTLEVALNCLALPDLTNDCRNFYRKVAISVARVSENFNTKEYYLYWAFTKCHYRLITEHQRWRSATVSDGLTQGPYTVTASGEILTHAVSRKR